MKRVCGYGKDCPLNGSFVGGAGSDSPVAMLVGEAPGGAEEAIGTPFVGKSGQELDMYLYKFAHIRRDKCYITNVVKCRPPNNRDPSVGEIAYCTEHCLVKEITRIRPKVIGTIGRVATSWFAGHKTTMEHVHGIPGYGWWNDEYQFIVVPMYHPAYGLHSTRRMQYIINDFRVLGEVVRGKVKPRNVVAAEYDYRRV